MTIDKRMIELEHPIKSLGRHDVTLRVGGGLTATISVIVERSSEPG